MFGRNPILAAALGFSCLCALPAQAQHYGHHDGGYDHGGGHYHGGGYHDYHPHYDRHLVPGYRYLVPDGYEGAPAGSIINYGGYNYIANGDGTMTLAS